MSASLENTRKELAGEYERVQKKAFTNWINSHLIKVGQHVTDLYEDLRDGSRLLMLIELLTGEKLRREKGKMRVHKLQNVQNILDYLISKRKIKLVNIHSESIVEGKSTPTLGLVWMLILHFQISGPQSSRDDGRPMSPVEVSAAVLKKKLLEWAQAATEGYDEVNVTNFHTSWKDGLAFCAILDRHRPDLLNYDLCDPDTPLSNLEMAMSVAEKELGIVRIIDPEDIYVKKPDEKAVMTYVSFLHNAFPHMPPLRRKKGPQVSLDEYAELFTATRQWVQEKTNEVTSRDFSVTVPEMKARIDRFHVYQSKDLPVKQRDVALLKDMYNQLQEQAAKKKKGPTVPDDMTFELLEAAWAGLERENGECEAAMTRELERLQRLEELAASVLGTVTTTSATLDQLEGDVAEFEAGCTSLSLADGGVEERARNIRHKLQALQKPLKEMTGGVQELEEGNYHDVVTISNSVDGVKARYDSLLSRLEGASSVATEAQEVVKAEGSIQQLEVWLVSCGKFAANQNILGQIEEHKMFEREQLAAAKGRVTRITGSPPPPGLEGKVTQMSSRWHQIVSQTEERLSGLEPLEAIAREFDRLKNPLEDWLLQQTEGFDGLPPVEIAVEELQKEQTSLGGLKEGIAGRKADVEKLEELASKFEMETEPVQSLADRYARRLKKQGSIPDLDNIEEKETSVEPEASFVLQADALQSVWASLQSKVDSRSRLVDNLLDRLNEFNTRYRPLREFIDEGERLLRNEKPIGDSAARLQEQVETCQEFRSRLTAKQPDVDGLLSLGREIIAEPQTSTANVSLETRLTGFIQDWSDLQLAWQNWSNELHAHKEQSLKLSEQVGGLVTAVRGLESVMKALLPANVDVDNLLQDLETLQGRYSAEVVQPYESLVATCDSLKSSTAMLTDQSRALEAFQIFDRFSSDITSCREELGVMVEDVRGWWGGCEEEKGWLDGAESTLVDLRSLAGSLSIIKTQQEKNERLSEEVAGHRERMEGILSSLATLASHDQIVEPATITEYRDTLRARWEAVLDNVEKRLDLSTSGHAHLTSYADQSTTFDQWLTSAEEKHSSMSTIPSSRDALISSCDEHRVFLEEVQSKAGDLDTVETTGSHFLASAKPYQVQLLEFRSKVSDDEPSRTSNYFVDPEADVAMTTAPEFHGTEYENGITIVKGYSSLLRKRYDNLLAGGTQLRQRVEEARQRRAEFDSCLEMVLPRLQELEKRTEGVRESRDKISDRLENLRVIEVKMVAMETQLQALNSSCDLLSELCDSGEQGGGGGGGEAGREREEVEARHRGLMRELGRLKDNLNAELSDAQAYQDVFSDFDAWLRDTERKIQRDDPLKLEINELKQGLTYLQGISADISAHESAYEKVRSECRDLIGRGVGDPEELQHNLDNLQQRWNAIQIVNDDIEAIETTIPKLELFYKSYDVISKAVVTVGDKLRGFPTSTTSSNGISERRASLKALHDEVEKQRSEFDRLLQSCDLSDTPFDQTQFESDVTTLRDMLAACDNAEAEKQASLTVLEKKISPMEDLFSQFRAWLSASETSLSSLSPPSTEETERTDQLSQANELLSDVTAHEVELEKLESTVNDVITLVDESDQSELSSRFQAVSLNYCCHCFHSQCYPVQRWLDDRSLQLCSMQPSAVLVPELQVQIQEAQDFRQVVEDYRPKLNDLDATSSNCCTPPTTPGGPKSANTMESVSKVTAKLQSVWERYNALDAMATERGMVLVGFLPSAQQYDSSRGAWGQNLEKWEDQVSKLPPPATKPDLIEQQIGDIKSLLQLISDHEPEYVSLKREGHTLCQGPSNEQGLLPMMSQLKDSSADFVAKTLDDITTSTSDPKKGESTSPGKPNTRPGQVELEATLSDYDRRLQDLKNKLRLCLDEREKQLSCARDYKGVVKTMMSCLEGGVAQLDGFKVCDPTSDTIRKQQLVCQSLIDDMSSREEEKARLRPLAQELTSDLSPDSEDRASLLAHVDSLNSQWDQLQKSLSECQERLEMALSHAIPYEDSVRRLLPWVPDTLSRLNGLGPCPTEPEAVEQRKNEIEAMKTEYNSLAPVCASCLENARSLSSACEPDDPRNQLVTTADSLRDDWQTLGALFGDVLEKLTEALVQTQEFKSIAGGLQQWMSGMGETLNQQELIAARVKLIEGQITGFKPILTDISAYGETVEKARVMGDSLKGESDDEERGKIERRLEGLTTQFTELQQSANTRMKDLENALDKATMYENRCDEFDQWLGTAEARLKAWEPLSIASQPLRRQEQEIMEFLQEVESYQSSLDDVTIAETSLLTSDLSTILSCESEVVRQAALLRRSSTPRASSVASPAPPAGHQSPVNQATLMPQVTGDSRMPGWLERPGASEAVVVGADIRSRYAALHADLQTRSDLASQQLQTVLGYEADIGHLSEWMEGQRSAIATFAPPAVTVDTIRAQITEVEDLQRGFTNKQENLESINARGTSLVDGCEDKLSQESGRIKLSDLNEAWSGCLGDLSTREDMLKGALNLAEKYESEFGEFDSWLSGCVEKAAEALRVDGDPSEIARQLHQQQALLDEVKAHKSSLTALTASGRALESYAQERGTTDVADTGYGRMEDRYKTLEASLEGRISKLQQTLDRVGSTTDKMRELLSRLEGWRDVLEHHSPPRVLPPDIEKQISEFSVLEQHYSDLQPAVSEALRQAGMFASAQRTEDDSSAELSQLHSALQQTNEEVGKLVGHWAALLRTGQTTANKFDQDYNGLVAWVKAKDEELLRAEAVAGIPDGIQTQITETQILQEEVTSHREDLTSLSTLSDTMSDTASRNDSLILSEKMARVKAAFEALERNVAARKRGLDDGMEQAKQFVSKWQAAMEAVTLKSVELHQMSPVGADIDSVKHQLEEHKEYSESVAELKPQISAVQTGGKNLKGACSTQDGPAITQQLEQLNTAWSKLNSDALSRKHQLEDALLQLGQFHDALAQILSWIADSTGKLTEAAPPGVKSEAVEMQLNELESLDSAISSHEPTVTSLNEAAQKLIASNTADNTPEIEQDIASLNDRWSNLKALAKERRSLLDKALEKAQQFHDRWKKESDWLTEAERGAYADWTPHGLPETCAAEITEHEVFAADVQSHQEPIESLRSEGDLLKTQGSPDDGKRVDHWVEDLAQRWDELAGTVDEKQVLLQQARDKAVEFDTSYQTLKAQLQQRDQTLRQQEPIHSEVEVVKKQLEENKEFHKGLSELEGQLDELEGMGLLLASDCVREDKDIILQRTNDLRALWDFINSAAMDRQATLEESLLSLGEFEEAYSELWAWLTDALRQLGEAEPITGDPDLVAAQLAKHKVLQKQLGARMSSRNAVTKAAKALMKQKTGEDRAVLKKKLQDLEREWEKVCQMSVDRQSRLEEAYRGIGQFRAYLGPLRSWMAKVLPSLDESEPVHGDMETVLFLADVLKSFQKELGAHQHSVDSANTSGQQLVAEVLDDPTVTQEDMQEMNNLWSDVCGKSVQKQECIDEALESAQSFEEAWSQLMDWIEVQRENLEGMPPPDEDANILQEQIEENKAFSQEVTAKQPEYDRVRAECQNLLQLAHPQAVGVLDSHLQQLERAWVDLRGRVGSRSEALASLLLELHGLQDMLDGLWEWVGGAEATMTTTEASPVGNDMETVELQLSQHEAFQEEMATHQPNMDALNKIAKKRKAETPTTNPEMTKKITSLYKRWQRLWLRSSERHRQLLEARNRLNDIALARSFNFDAWRRRFNAWVDQQKLRVNDLFRRFDSNHDGLLSREEFMKGLKASGLAMNQIELEKIADHFDRDHDGYIDLSEINSILRGIRRARSLAKRQPVTDSEKIDHEIRHQVSKCSCSKKFRVIRVAEGQYRFGDSQKLRLVRILRSTVMVRVGGGWEPLEEFLRKHDPCRAAGRTNTTLRGMDPGLTTAVFGTKAQTAISSKNTELRRDLSSSGTDKLTVTDPSGRKHTMATKRTTTTVTRQTTGTKSSRETTPTRTSGAAGRSEPLRHMLVRQASPKTKSSHHPSPPRSKTPSRALSPSGESGRNGQRTVARGATSNPTTPTHIPKLTRRPISPSSAVHTATGIVPKASAIPTPSRSKIPKTTPRPK